MKLPPRKVVALHRLVELLDLPSQMVGLPTPTTRVAIYTRQSVANDLEFGSIEAQRETVGAYVISQRSKGWVALPERCDDSGFSGGNIERPAFQRMMADLDAGKIDVIAAYKTDRVSRSLNDFTRFMETLARRDGVEIQIRAKKWELAEESLVQRKCLPTL